MKLPEVLDNCLAEDRGSCIYPEARRCPYAYALMNIGDAGATAYKHCSKLRQERTPEEQAKMEKALAELQEKHYTASEMTDEFVITPHKSYDVAVASSTITQKKKDIIK